MAKRERCGWAGETEIYLRYHDEEWGVPLRERRGLFELLCLEGAQAGLSWLTILRKRENYRAAFENFVPEKIAVFDERRVAALLANEGIVRNRLKISSVVGNARALLRLEEEGDDFVEHLWSFVGGAPRINSFSGVDRLPASTEQSEAMSRDLRRRGFRFVGPTICYALMQAAGMVNDHLTSCFRYGELGG